VRQRRQPILIGLTLALTALSGCAGLTVDPGTAPVAEEVTARGLLEFPDGLALVMAPRRGPSYAVFEACGVTEDLRIRLVRISPVRLTGAEAVRFEAAWPVSGQRPLPGGGGLPLPEAYEPSAGSSGVVRGCGTPPANLEIAAVLPPAVTADVIVDGIEVVYEVVMARLSFLQQALTRPAARGVSVMRFRT
jgi:hypothetical protein